MAKGFSLIELLLVIGMMMILGGMGLSVSGMFVSRRALSSGVDAVISSVSTARINSMSHKGGHVWGVRSRGSSVVVFMGSNYSNRDSSMDESFDVKGVMFNDVEVVFNVFGMPNNSVEFDVRTASGIKRVIVNSSGGIDVE